MSEITPVSRSGVTTPTQGARPAVQDKSTTTTTRPSDRVEFSQAAQLLSKLAELPDVRQDVVDRVRGEIAKGNYETDDKIEAAIDKLGEDLA
ncbi:MAG: flagellar biosynthesis anti-sigma factor FlgM [Planctomycetes bacterium]|nr:flagellar biosynthesis anti-sigma factor FlgM [Planctomycetota bacterium]